MPNSSLQGKYFTPTDKVINKIQMALSKANLDSSEKGFRKAKEILSQKKISYEQLKKIKHFFDNYKGDGFDSEFKLLGGETMKKWADEVLGTSRDVVHDEKQSRMDAGEENQFIKTHEKDKDNADPTNVRMVKVHKGSDMRNIMANDTIYEQVESIKYLMDYMDKKTKN